MDTGGAVMIMYSQTWLFPAVQKLRCRTLAWRQASETDIRRPSTCKPLVDRHKDRSGLYTD